MVDLLWIFVTGLLLGLLVGCELSWRRWRDNADQPQKIEWRGRLFKVIPGWLYDDLISDGAPVIPGKNYKAEMGAWLRGQRAR